MLKRYGQWRPDTRPTFNLDSSIISAENSCCLDAQNDTIHTLPGYYAYAPSLAVFGDLVHLISRDYHNEHLYYSRSIDNGNTWEPTIDPVLNPTITPYISLSRNKFLLKVSFGSGKN
jgi:hypothetical protein|uniref:Exo-alpha-sialidase n=1 Tax=candidate division WOR-3 bacterium TaxID=2052148 RepID=A0A7V3RH51_UNCW3